MTNEQRTSQIRALLEERRGYEARGLTDRVNDVNTELTLIGYEGAPVATRAEKRPRSLKLANVETR